MPFLFRRKKDSLWWVIFLKDTVKYRIDKLVIVEYSMGRLSFRPELLGNDLLGSLLLSFCFRVVCFCVKPPWFA